MASLSVRRTPSSGIFRPYAGRSAPEHVVATAWVLQHPAVASAIVGVHPPEQLDGLDRAASLVIEDVAMTRLKEIFDINRGRGIGQGRSPQAYAW
jgi:aryl-alcohol dehydrogenase-like predicted oxidoreductase